MTKAEKDKQADRQKQEKQHDREVLVSKAKLVMIVVCLIAIPVTFWWNHKEASDVRGRVAKVESPCLKYGSKSRQCHESFSAAIRSITDYQLCSLLAQRPDLTRVHPEQCARIARQARRRVEEATASPAADQGGEAPSTPQTGSSQPEPPSGGSQPGPAPGGSAGGQGGSPQPASGPDGSQSPSPAPQGSAPDPSPAPPAVATPSAPATEPPPAETPPPSESEAPKQPISEAVGGAVEEVTETVNGVVCGVTGALHLPCK